ncbi:riboflavin synthase subunit alpha [Aestuariirhabdus sp. Z084]|uniref:riboflavin synthase subunit alpha n=1 Tax=Aestuariirhabdus haliotis TaxID=2918751 RepID=UPI00201B41A2|nr:riboflavin synthase subunit alpha [Aestuariirhabdus haliotis]MCL6416535.1 riboflavin synthase subunit alpha [Aestuariirhabdus haliotis]MCL6420525.1 riboflavin synthase subunit alpha [Aestuariirhabdus haliotis]
MFTGIVQCSLPLSGLESKPGLKRFWFDFPSEMLADLSLGASVAVNGACLTVAAIDGSRIGFDVMQETLRVTNLAQLESGSYVNLERAARFNDEIGGHLLSGHVHDRVEVLSVERPENNCIITFSLAPEWQPYLFAKGFVALNGASLTVGEVEPGQFNVYLIPETLKITTFDNLKVGDKVNLEIDSQTQVIVDTVKRMSEAGQIHR